MKKPLLRSSKTVYHGFFDVRLDTLVRDDGELFNYTSMALPGDAVAILAQTTDGLWVLNREYRHPAGEWVLGCPGGRLEKGEDPITGAKRELFEETGYWSDEVILTGTSFPMPSLLNQKIYFLFAKNASKKSMQHLDPFEFIEIELKTDEELFKEIKNNSKTDGILSAALWYKFLATC